MNRRCNNRKCRRLIRESERRTLSVPQAHDMPGYDEPDGGCMHCAPTHEDEDRAEDARNEDRFARAQEDR